MSQDAYTRIAVRLRDLSPRDREWFLGQLAPDDCKRISAALREHRSQALSGASVEGVRQILAGQPDFVIALVLSVDQWPWTQDFLGALSPERIRALRTLAAELSSRVKPKMLEALVRSIAAKLNPPEAMRSQATLPFDAALEQATRELSVTVDLPGDRELSAGGEWRLDRI
jgi:hypothetical protein